MIDFFDASDSQETQGETIPPNSCVKVRLEIVMPSEEKRGNCPELHRSAKGLEYLATKLHVVDGTYADNVIYQNFNLEGGDGSPGHTTSKNIARAQIKAILKFSRGLHTASEDILREKLRIDSYTELDGLEFPIMVKCEKGTLMNNGNFYFCNNKMKKILVPKDKEYVAMLENPEVISSDPIPVFPADQSAAQNWSQPQQYQSRSQSTGFQATTYDPAKGYVDSSIQTSGAVDDVPF